jgi:hypothetical protein
MTLEIKRGTSRRIIQDADGFTLQVQVDDPTSQELAEMALEHLRSQLEGLNDEDDNDDEPGDETPSPNFVSEVIRLPSGPFLYVDAHEMPKRVIGTIPDVLLDLLESLGVKEGKVCVPSYDAQNHASKVGRLREPLAVVAFPRTGDRTNPFPPEWFALAEQWLLGGSTTATVGAIVHAVTFDVVAGQVGVLLHQLGNSAGIRLATKANRTIRFVDFHKVGRPRLVLAVGGQPLGTEGPDTDMEFAGLLAVLTDLAKEDAFGFLTLETDMLMLYRYVHIPPDVSGAPMPAIPDFVARFADSVLFDAFPAQILGPQHRQRLANLDLEWLRDVSPTRDLLLLPAPLEEWRPGSPQYETTMRHFRQLLATCFTPPIEG